MRTLGLALPRPFLLIAFAVALALLLLLTRAAAAQTAERAASPVGDASSTGLTHELVKTIAVRGEDSANRLQTLCLAADGNVAALVAPPRDGLAPQESTTCEVQVFDPRGNAVRKWKVHFLGQAINACPDGSILVAGDGHIARFDKQGKTLAEAELPLFPLILPDAKKLRALAQEQLMAEVQSMEETLRCFKTQKAALEAKDASERTALDKSQLKMVETNLEKFEQVAKEHRKTTLEQAVHQITSRLKIITGVAANDHDVFVSCGEGKGYYYAVWRMESNFTQPKEIITELEGCCGQMDIQAQGDELLVAENSRHRVGRFNREGKSLGSFGKFGLESDPQCFGGCCNPMNCRIVSGGTVYTAESQGFVKEFSPKGDFVRLVAYATVKGGCKNAAVALAPDGKTIYFCDQLGSKIIVMASKN